MDWVSVGALVGVFLAGVLVNGLVAFTVSHVRAPVVSAAALEREENARTVEGLSQQVALISDALRTHNHDAAYSLLSHEHPHDHPHQHEHVQHTHSLEKVSEHEEQGKRVIVKRCNDCGTVFRDKQD